MWRRTNRRILFLDSLGITKDPISKLTIAFDVSQLEKKKGGRGGKQSKEK
jgi:hypothetical protein